MDKIIKEELLGNFQVEKSFVGKRYLAMNILNKAEIQKEKF